jgi:transposase
MYPDTVKLEAQTLRLQGFTLREIGQKLDVNHQTVATWCAPTPEASQARLQRKFDGDQELALMAQQRLTDRLPTLEDRDLIRTYSATTNAVHSTLRLLQDERHHNDQLDAIRNQLRTKQPAELALLLTEHSEDPAVIQVIPPDSEP